MINKLLQKGTQILKKGLSSPPLFVADLGSKWPFWEHGMAWMVASQIWKASFRKGPLAQEFAAIAARSQPRRQRIPN